MAITQVPVHGTVKEADGSIAAGATVSFALKAAITDGTFIVSTEPVVATCDGSGAFTQTLYATDDSTTTPTGSYYTVTIKPAGKNWITIEQFDFVLPHADSAGVDLFALAPLTNPSISSPYVAQIVAGTGVTLSPTGGTGVVTVNAAGGGGSSVPAMTDLGSLGATTTLPTPGDGDLQSGILTQNLVITPPSAPAAGDTVSFKVKLTQDSTGGWTWGFASAAKFPAGVQIPLSAAGAENWMEFVWDADTSSYAIFPATSGATVVTCSALDVLGGAGGRLMGFQSTGVEPTQASPQANDFWIDTHGSPSFWLWNGTIWENFGAGGGGGTVTLSSPDDSVVIGGAGSAPTLEVAASIPRLTGSPGPYMRAGYDPTLGEWIPVSPGYVPLAQHFNISAANADNQPAIVAAVQAMYNDGLKGELPPGALAIKEQVVLGNGSSNAVSTWAPFLKGASVPAKNGFANALGTSLVWANGTGFGSPLVVLQGPFQGWELDQLTIDGGAANSAGAPALGLQLVSVQNGKADFLVVTNVKSGIQHTTVGVKKTTVGGVSANCSNNDLRSVMVGFLGASTLTYGVQFTEGSGAGGNGNCCYEDYEDLWIQQLTGTGGANPRFGLYFQRCDSNRIHSLHISNGGMAASICYDYQSYNTWPAGNVIDGHVELGGAACPVIELGAPAQSTTSGGGTKNVIMVPPSCVNGSSPDPSIVPGVSSDATYNTQNGGTNVGLSQNVTWGDPYLHGEATLVAGVKNVTCKFAIPGTPVLIEPVSLAGTPGNVVGVVTTAGTIAITSYQFGSSTAVQTADTGTYLWRLMR